MSKLLQRKSEKSMSEAEEVKVEPLFRHPNTDSTPQMRYPVDA